MSCRPKYDNIPASDRASDVLAAEVLAVALRQVSHRLDALSLVREARATLRPMPRYEKRTTSTQDVPDGESAT